MIQSIITGNFINLNAKGEVNYTRSLKVSPFVQQSYCTFSFSLSLQKKDEHKKSNGSTKGHEVTLCDSLNS